VGHAAESFSGRRFYVGDLHVHSGASADGGASDAGLGCPFEACGPIAGVFQAAREAGLDFVSLTDHVNGESASSAYLFETLHRQALAAHDPAGGFVTIPGAELFLLAGGDPLGHRNLYLFGEDDALASFRFEDARFSCGREEIEACENTWAFLEQLEGRFGPLALIPHHPAGRHPMPVDWGCHHPRFAPAVEIYSKHGNGLDPYSGYDTPIGPIRAASTGMSAIDPRRHGLRLGFVGATDNHGGLAGAVCEQEIRLDTGVAKYGGGLTVVVRPEHEPFDRASVYAALTERDVYATSGPLLRVSAEYSAGGARLGEMGDVLVPPPGAGALDVVVSLPAAQAPLVLAVDVVTPDEALLMEDLGGGRYTLHLEDPPTVHFVRLRLDGAAWYGDAGCDDGGQDTEERIWLSPAWWAPDGDDPPPEPTPGAWLPPAYCPDAIPPETGCAAAHRRPVGLTLLLALLLLARRTTTDAPRPPRPKAPLHPPTRRLLQRPDRP